MRLTALDGLRGVAALFVVGGHVEVLFSKRLPFFWKGYLAVDFFFLLSGFVLAMTYDRRLASGMSVREFMLRRILRLGPLYWLGCALGAVALIYATGPTTGERALTIVSGIFLIPSWPGFSRHIFLINPPAWSLFFEVAVANLLFAALWKQLHGYVLIAISAVAAALFLWAIKTHGHGEVGSDQGSFAWGFPRVIFSFFLGVALFRFRSAMPVFRVPAWPLAVLLALSFLFRATGHASMVYDAFCVCVLYPALVYLGAEASEISPRTGYVCGEISYALYVVHYPILCLPPVAALAARAWPNGAGWHTWYQIPITAALALIAWAVVQLYDLPVQKALARRRRRTAAAGNGDLAMASGGLGAGGDR